MPGPRLRFASGFVFIAALPPPHPPAPPLPPPPALRCRAAPSQAIYGQYFAYLAGGRKYTTAVNNKLQVAYAVHCVFIIAGFIIQPLAQKAAGPDIKGPESGVLGDYNIWEILNVMTYIHAWCLVSFMWALTVVKYPGKCCMTPWNAAAWFATWMALAIAFDASSTYLQIHLMQYEWFFAIPAIVLVADIFVLLPITHWSVHACLSTTYKGVQLDVEDPAAAGDEGAPLQEKS